MTGCIAGLPMGQLRQIFLSCLSSIVVLSRQHPRPCLLVVVVTESGSEAWNIVATSFNDVVADSDDDAVADPATNVAKAKFSEGLLRNILDLDRSQQLELCEKLAKGKDKKGHKYGKADFKNDAIWYRGYNVLWDIVIDRLKEKIPEAMLDDFMLPVHAELANAAEIGSQLGYDPTMVESPPDRQLRPLKSVPEADRKAI